jgi:glyoxylase-like metal-dependent hydrolase (beta-lactamase superfamily II)
MKILGASVLVATTTGLALFLGIGCAAGEAGPAKPAAVTKAGPAGPPAGIGRRDNAQTIGPYKSGALTLVAHQSAEYSATVNSWIIEGPTEMGLVDAQLVMPEGERLVELLRARNKRLAWVWITHAHPDHYAGLQAVAAAFPGVPLRARPATVTEAPALLREYDAPLQRFFPGEMTTQPVALTAFDGDALEVDGVSIQIVDLTGGEHTSTTALVIPSSRAMLIADLVYHRVHPWLNELDTDGVLRHVDALALRDDVDTFYPGHGEPFDKAYLPVYRKYVLDFLADAKVAKDANDLVLRTWQRYPDWRTMAGLRFSAAAHIQARKK